MVSASTLTGAAGEHYVMSELLRRGLIAALAPTGVPNCDIIVTDEIGERLCAVQVKTRNNTGADGGWHMSKKHESLTSSSLFYCLVDFAVGRDDPPFTYVMPAAVVAKALAECHQAWLHQPGKQGQQRNDNDMRRLLPATTTWVWRSIDQAGLSRIARLGTCSPHDPRSASNARPRPWLPAPYRQHPPG